MEEINNINNTPKIRNFRVLYFLITIVIILIIGFSVYLIPKSKEGLLVKNTTFTVDLLPESLRDKVEVTSYNTDKFETDNGKFGKVTLEYSTEENCWKLGSYNAKSDFVETCQSPVGIWEDYSVFAIYSDFAYIFVADNKDFIYILLKEEDLKDEFRSFINSIFQNLISDNEYKSNSLNIQLTLPSGWEEIKPDELAYIPEFFSNPKLILRNAQKSCIIVAYTPFKQSGTKQTGRGDDRTNGPERWFAPEANIPSYVNIYQTPVQEGVYMVTKFKNPREEIKGEFKQYGSFYLYDENASTVNDECEQDIKTIATTKKSYYEKYTLNNSSEGILRFGGPGLIFTPKNTSDNLLVATTSRVSSQNNIIIFGKRIYFIINNDNSATIEYYDVFTGKFETVKETIGKHGYISSMSLIDDKIIYIAGPKEFGYCLDLPKDKCLNASLYKYSFNEDKVDLLAENIKGSNVLGVDESGSIYFSLSWGDAGAWFATIYKYKDGSIEQYKNYLDTSQIEEYEKFSASLRNMKGYQSILFKNGGLLPGPEISEYSKNNYFFTN